MARSKFRNAHKEVDLRRRTGTLHELTGEGGLNERQMQLEWNHRLSTMSFFAGPTNGMSKKQRKDYFEHEREVFFDRIRKAYTRARVQLDFYAPTLLDAVGGFTPRSEEERHKRDLEVALRQFQQERLRELNDPSHIPNRNPPRAPFNSAGRELLSQEEYEALAMAKIGKEHPQERRQELSEEGQRESTQVISEGEDRAVLLTSTDQEYEQPYRHRSTREPLPQESKRAKKKARRVASRAVRTAIQIRDETLHGKPKISKGQRRKARKARQREQHVKVRRWWEDYESHSQTAAALTASEQAGIGKKVGDAQAGVEETSSSFWQSMKNFGRYGKL